MPIRACDNPFRVDRLHQLKFRPAGAVEAVLCAFARTSQRGAIVGPHGTGKTTLLEEIRTQLLSQQQPVTLLRLSASRRATAPAEVAEWLRKTTADHVLLLDGAEQLSAWQWFKFSRAARGFAGVLITTHRPGRLPMLFRTFPSQAVLGDLIRELVPEIADRHSAEQLLQKHRGNLRDALRQLYDDWQPESSSAAR